MPTIVLGAVQIDSNTRQVQHPEGKRRLSPKEMKLLLYLYGAAPRVVSLEELLKEVWGYAPTTRSRTATMTLARLRKKIEMDPDEPRFFVTVQGQGIRCMVQGTQANQKIKRNDQNDLGCSLQFEDETSAFVGRDEALKKCMGWAKHGRWLTLSGAGGAGKTRLAKAFAQKLQTSGHFKDGVLFLPLVDLDRKEDLFPALLTLLGVEQSLGQAPLSTVIHLIEGRHVALFLDNAEHLNGLAPLLEALLSACPNLALVVTSRRVMGSVFENVLPVKGLESADASLSLFRSFLRHFARGRTLAVLEDETILSWLERLEHHALSIRLSAALCASRGGIFLDVEKGLTAAVSGQTSSRHLNLRSVFNDTWKDLSEGGQRALARLSLLYSPFDEDVVNGAIDVGVAFLEELELWGLLEGTAGAFTLHPMTRTLAREKLSGMPGLRGIEDNKHRYFIQKLAGWQPHLLGSNEVQNLNRVDRFYGDFRRALKRRLPEKLWQEASLALDACTTYLKQLGRAPEVVTLCRQVSRQTGPGILKEMAILLQARLFLGRMDYARAWDYLDRPMPLLKDKAQLERTLLHLYMGRIEEGTQLLSHLTQPSHPVERIYFHTVSAIIFSLSERWDAALGAAYKALEDSRRLGSSICLAKACHRLGTILHDYGKNSEALAIFKEAMKVLEGRPESRLQIALLIGLGNSYRNELKHFEAIGYYLNAETMAKRLHSESLLSMIYLNIGFSYREVGELSLAETHVKRGLSICESFGDTREKVQLMMALASIHVMRSELKLAMDLYQSCAERMRGKHSEEVRLSLVNSAYLSLEMGAYQRAIDFGDEILGLDDSGLSSSLRLFLSMVMGCAGFLMGKGPTIRGLAQTKAALQETFEAGSPSLNALVLAVFCRLLERVDLDLARRVGQCLPDYQSYERLKTHLGVTGQSGPSVDSMVGELLADWTVIFSTDDV